MLDQFSKRPWYRIVIYLWTIWSDWWGWLFLLLLRVFPARRIIQSSAPKTSPIEGVEKKKWSTLGHSLHWIDGSLWIVFTPGTWLTKTVDFHGGCIGHGGWLKNAKDITKIDTKTEFHEHIHVHQHEVMQLLVLIQSSLNFLFFGADYWTFVFCLAGSPLAYLCAMMVAFLRGEDSYRDNIMEESAYAQSAGFNVGKVSLYRIAEKYQNDKLGI